MGRKMGDEEEDSAGPMGLRGALSAWYCEIWYVGVPNEDLFGSFKQEWVNSRRMKQRTRKACVGFARFLSSFHMFFYEVGGRIGRVLY